MVTKKTLCFEYGDKGKDIEKAQLLLQKAGSSIKMTGIFTIGMVSAVKAFQKKNGLKVTGIIDPKTWEKLNAKPAKKASTKKAGVKK